MKIVITMTYMKNAGHVSIPYIAKSAILNVLTCIFRLWNFTILLCRSLKHLKLQTCSILLDPIILFLFKVDTCRCSWQYDFKQAISPEFRHLIEYFWLSWDFLHCEDIFWSKHKRFFPNIEVSVVINFIDEKMKRLFCVHMW